MIRVPDGLKERVAERARANGRSMSAEVLSIIEKEMGDPDSSRLRELEARLHELMIAEDVAKVELSHLQDRIGFTRAELAHYRERDTAEKARNGNS